MKKLIAVLMFIYSTTTISHAGIFKDRSEIYDFHGNNDGRNYLGDSSYSREDTSEDYGGFFRSSTAEDLDDRPGNGSGIGQNAPVGDCIPVIIACCIAFVLLRLKKRDRAFGKRNTIQLK